MKFGKQIVLVAAIDVNHGLGKDGKVLYSIKEDLQRFKDITKDTTVVMGRKTAEEIFKITKGKMLPFRVNHVVSRTGPVFGDAKVYSDIDLAIMEAPTHKVCIIGGETLYEDTIVYADMLAITHIADMRTADAYFPYINPEHWVSQVSEYRTDPGTGLQYAFRDWYRK